MTHVASLSPCCLQPCPDASPCPLPSSPTSTLPQPHPPLQAGPCSPALSPQLTTGPQPRLHPASHMLPCPAPLLCIRVPGNCSPASVARRIGRGSQGKGEGHPLVSIWKAGPPAQAGHTIWCPGLGERGADAPPRQRMTAKSLLQTFQNIACAGRNVRNSCKQLAKSQERYINSFIRQRKWQCFRIFQNWFIKNKK